METVKRRFELLYEGRSRVALVFRICLLGFDVLTISLFLVLAFVDEHAPWVLYVDVIVAAVLTFDYVAGSGFPRESLPTFFISPTWRTLW